MNFLIKHWQNFKKDFTEHKWSYIIWGVIGEIILFGIYWIPSTAILELLNLSYLEDVEEFYFLLMILFFLVILFLVYLIRISTERFNIDFRINKFKCLKKAIIFIVIFVLLQVILGFFVLSASFGGFPSWPKWLVKFIGIIALIIVTPSEIFGFTMVTIIVGTLISIFFTGGKLIHKK